MTLNRISKVIWGHAEEFGALSVDVYDRYNEIRLQVCYPGTTVGSVSEYNMPKEEVSGQ